MEKKEYIKEVNNILSWSFEFPNYQLGEKTDKEIEECYNKGLSIQDAVTEIIWGMDTIKK